MNIAHPFREGNGRSYASMRDIKRKSLEELIKLKEAGFSDLHIGIETGYKPAFEMMNKGVTYEEQLDTVKKRFAL